MSGFFKKAFQDMKDSAKAATAAARERIRFTVWC